MYACRKQRGIREENVSHTCDRGLRPLHRNVSGKLRALDVARVTSLRVGLFVAPLAEARVEVGFSISFRQIVYLRGQRPVCGDHDAHRAHLSE